MSRWYKVTFADGNGNYRGFVSSGNTRKTAERASRWKLKDEVGESHKNWRVVGRIIPTKPPSETGGPT